MSCRDWVRPRIDARRALWRAPVSAAFVVLWGACSLGPQAPKPGGSDSDTGATDTATSATGSETSETGETSETSPTDTATSPTTGTTSATTDPGTTDTTETGTTTGPGTAPCQPIAIAAGKTHTCASLGAHGVRCWGKNDADSHWPMGYVGVEHISGGGERTLASMGPVPIPASFGDPVKIAAGFDHTCVLNDEGRVLCWGEPNFVGVPPVEGVEFVAPNDAVSVPFRDQVRELHAGSQHTCALVGFGGDNERVHCWGINYLGALGVGSKDNVFDAADGPPALLPESDSDLHVATGASHSCVALGDDPVSCWGSGVYGRLGTYIEDPNEAQAVTTPLAPPNGLPSSGYVDIAAGNFHTCARRSNGFVHCWGCSRSIGTGTQSCAAESIPSAMDDASAVFDFGSAKPTLLAAGHQHSCVARDDRTVVCWGYGFNGQLGFDSGCDPNDNQFCVFPLDGELLTTESQFCFPKSGETAVDCADYTLHDLREPKALALGSRQTCVLLEWEEDGPRSAVRCWGYNDEGLLGYDEPGFHTARDAVDLVFDCSDEVTN